MSLPLVALTYESAILTLSSLLLKREVPGDLTREDLFSSSVSDLELN